jgi:hypothetical protein
MLAELPLKNMTLEEKLLTIETVWDDICHGKEDIPTPAWHEDVLRLREQQIKSGHSKFYDLDEAKNILKKRLG